MQTGFKKAVVGGVAAAALIISAGVTATTVPLSVTFTGTVVDNTCGTPTVSGGGTVAFGNIAKSDFTGLGSIGGTRDFTITFAGCGDDTSGVSVWFSGTTGNTIHAVDNPTAAGYASGIGVQVYGNNTLLESDNTTATTTFTTIGSTGGTIQLQARVVQTTATAPGQGVLNAEGTVYVQYL